MNSLFNGMEARATELYAHVPDGTAGQVGTVLVGVGIALTMNYMWKMWPVWKQQREAKRFAASEAIRKAKRTQEAMDIREVRLREMLSEMITDGILDRQVTGEISNQEGRRLMAQLSLKLNLPDLVPTKTRAKIIKEEIKARFHKGLYKRNPLLEPRLVSPPKAVNPPATNKYWKPKPVAA